MKYIRICRVHAIRYEFIPTPSGQYTAVKFWNDLESLDGCIIDNTKLFITHDKSREVYSEPIIYIVAVVEASNKSDAIDALVLDTANSLAHFTMRYNCSFGVMQDQTFFTQLHVPYQFSLLDVGIQFMGKRASHFAIMDPTRKKQRPDGFFEGPSLKHELYGYDTVVKHRDCLSQFATVHVPEPHKVNINVNQLKRKDLPPEGPLHLVPKNSLQGILFNLYGDSIACSNPLEAFSPLWKIVEVIERQPERSPLLSAKELQELNNFLGGFGNEVRTRLIASARSMDSRTQAERFIDGVKIVFPTWNGSEENAKSTLRKSREARGRLFHPNRAVDPYHREILEAYAGLKAMIFEILNSPFHQ